MIEHFEADVLIPQVKKVKDVMISLGVAIPEIAPDRPKVEPQLIPPGARLTDSEISNMLVAKLEGLLLLCYQGVSRSVRDDIAAMFVNFQTHIQAQGFTMKYTMQKRGWLRVPPPYYSSLGVESR